MRKPIRYFMLGFLYILFFTIGFTILENVESKKVTPFEHVHIGFYYGVYIGLLIFLIIILPMTIVTDFLLKQGIMIKIILFSSVGVVIGAFMFPFINPEWVEIDGFILNRETSLSIFGVVGFLYSLITIISDRTKE